MKILIVSNLFAPFVLGGYDLIAYDQAREFQQRGHKVIVATTANDPRHAKPFDKKKLAALDIRRVFMPIRCWMWDHFYQDVWWAKPELHWELNHSIGGYIEPNVYAMRHLMETEKPDVVLFSMITMLGPLGLVETALAYKGTKVFLHLENPLDEWIRERARKIELEAKWLLLKRRVHAIACTRAIAIANERHSTPDSNLIARWIDLFRRKPDTQVVESRFASMQVIYNSVDSRLWKRVKPKTFAGKGPLKLIHWGRLAPGKGLQQLMEACEYIHKNTSLKVELDLYGTGEPGFVEKLKKEIKDRKLTDIFHLKGFLAQTEIIKRIKDYHVALFLLHNDEPFGNVMIESILTGIYTIFPADLPINEVFGPSPMTVRTRTDFASLTNILTGIARSDKKLARERERMYDVVKNELDLRTRNIPAFEKAFRKASPAKGFDPEIPASCARMYHFVPHYEGLNDFGGTSANFNLKKVRYAFFRKAKSPRRKALTMAA